MKKACFSALALSILMNFVSAQESNFPTPELKSAETPAAIPADHQAILESKEIVDRVMDDQYFKLIDNAKIAKMNEVIAIAHKGEAEANAVVNELTKHTNQPVIDSASQSSEDNKEAAEKAKKSEAEAKYKSKLNSDKALLNRLVLASISSNSALIRINGSTSEMTVGSTANGIKLVSINLANHAVNVSTVSTGQSKVLKLSDYSEVSTGNIKPLKKADEGQSSKNIERN